MFTYRTEVILSTKTTRNWT